MSDHFKMDNNAFPEGIYKRTHVYQHIEYGKPKQYFIDLGDQLEALDQPCQKIKLIDIGGASGAFCYYVSQRFPEFEINCLEYDKELCEIGVKNVPKCTFINGNANHMEGIPDRSYDIVTMLGVMTIFDDFRPSLKECLRVTKSGGSILILGQFNEHPIDVIQRYQYSGKSNWNKGWNIFSKQSINEFLMKKNEVSDWSYKKFILPFDLPKNEEDPIRTWTETSADGQRIFKNGLNLEVNLQFLHIVLKS